MRPSSSRVFADLGLRLLGRDMQWSTCIKSVELGLELLYDNPGFLTATLNSVFQVQGAGKFQKYGRPHAKKTSGVPKESNTQPFLARLSQPGRRAAFTIA